MNSYVVVLPLSQQCWWFFQLDVVKTIQTPTLSYLTSTMSNLQFTILHVTKFSHTFRQIMSIFNWFDSQKRQWNCGFLCDKCLLLRAYDIRIEALKNVAHREYQNRLPVLVGWFTSFNYQINVGCGFVHKNIAATKINKQHTFAYRVSILHFGTFSLRIHTMARKP